MGVAPSGSRPSPPMDTAEKKPSLSVVVHEASLLGAMGLRIGESLTPLRISSVLRAADAGQLRPLHDLLNEIRQKDGSLHSILQTREGALLSCGWAITADVEGLEKDTPEYAAAEEKATYCREVVGKMRVQIGEFSFGLDRAIAHLMDALYKGVAVLEILWAKIGVSLVPTALAIVEGRRLAWSQEARLCFYDPDTFGVKGGAKLLSSSWPGVPLGDYSGKFIVHLPRVNGDSPQREGLGRLLLWLACFRLWSVRDWLLFAELYGKPYREFIYKTDGTVDEDRLMAETMARFTTSKTAMVHSDQVEVKVSWPEATGGAQASPSPAIMQAMRDDMALATIGQLATTSDTTNGLGGSGDARDLVRQDIKHADEVQLSDTLRWQLLARIVRLKYGNVDRLPHWSFLTDDAVDVKATLEAMAIGAKLGMKIPVAHAHDVTGWPTASDGEPALDAPEPVAPLPSGAAPKTDGPSKDQPGKEAA